VAVLENEVMYNSSFEVSEEAMDHDFLIPLGKAKVMREGKDITFVSFSKCVGLCMEAAKQLESQGVSAEVINLRTLRPFDRETMVNSVRKTHRLVCVEEGWPQSGVCAEIISVVCEECFDDLDASPERITGFDVPCPYAINLEDAAMPTIDNVLKAAKKVL